MKVVIMAGGRGTRISELFPDIPKPLIPIEGVPVLERELVPPAGQVVLVQLRLLGSLAAVRCGRGQHKLQLHLKAEDRGKRLLEQIGIARRRKPHDDVVGNLQDDDVRALKIQQIEVLDENSV